MTNSIVKKNGAYTLSFGKAFDIRRRQLFLFLHRTSKSKRIMPRFNRDGIKRFTLKFDVFRVPMERELCSPGGREKNSQFSVSEDSKGCENRAGHYYKKKRSVDLRGSLQMSLPTKNFPV